MRTVWLWVVFVVCVTVVLFGLAVFGRVTLAAETRHEFTLRPVSSLVLYDAFEIVEIRSEYPFELVHRGEVYPPISGETVVRGGRLEAGIWGLTGAYNVKLVLTSEEPQEVVVRLKESMVFPVVMIVFLALVVAGATFSTLVGDG